MLLMASIFLSSFGCLLVCLLTLAIVIKYAYHKGDIENISCRDEALLITGCDSGIGLELAKYFYNSTNFTIICGLLIANESHGRKELESLGDNSDRLILKPFDITSDQEIKNLVKFIDDLKSKRKIKEIKALINNAGIMTYGEFDCLTWDQIYSQVQVNIIGTLKITRAIVPYIIHSGGRILNVSSVNDTIVFPGLSIYSATKSAQSIFSRGLGFELRKFGAHVITIRLGDFVRLTNIMSNHAKFRDDMWNEMSSKKRDLYNKFFHEFNSHMMYNYDMTSPRKFSDSTLYLDFRRALLSKHPPTTITCAPILFKIFYSLIEIMPIWIQYYLLNLLVEFVFRWRTPLVTKKEENAKPNTGAGDQSLDSSTLRIFDDSGDSYQSKL